MVLVQKYCFISIQIYMSSLTKTSFLKSYIRFRSTLIKIFIRNETHTVCTDNVTKKKKT